MLLEPAKQIDALLQLYRNTHKETIRYRDLEWRVTVWIVTLMVGICASVKSIPPPINISISISPHAVVIIVVLIVFGYGLWHLHYIHRRLTEARNRYRDCQRLLGFYDAAVVWTSAVLPKREKGEQIGYLRGWQHLLSWALTMAAATVFAIVVIWNWH